MATPNNTQVHSLTTTFLIPNLHCPSCVSAIRTSLNSLVPAPSAFSHSIVSHSITIQHESSLSTASASAALERAGFEVYTIFQDVESNEEIRGESPVFEKALDTGLPREFAEAVDRWTGRASEGKSKDPEKMKLHFDQCELCRAGVGGLSPTASHSREHDSIPSEKAQPGGGKNGLSVGGSDETSDPHPPPFVVVDSSSESTVFRACLMVRGMTCSSCVAAITRALDEKPWISSSNVSLLTNSASVTFNNKDHLKDILEVIEDVGYDVSVESVDEIHPKSMAEPAKSSNLWQASYVIGGMTCSSCVGKIREALRQYDWVKSSDINLITHSGNIVFEGKENLSRVQSAIEGTGYEVTLESLVHLNSATSTQGGRRTVTLRIDGMHCSHCPTRVAEALDRAYGERVKVEKMIALADPLLKITYAPQTPDFTIRDILATLSSIDPALTTSIYHPPTLEARSRQMQIRERQHVLFRLGLAFVVAIPTFIIGIVLMSLVPSTNSSRRFVMQPMWAGQVTRADWALFILATPVYFFSADAFHRPALRELRALWRPGSKTPLLKRFYHFGSMNMLMSLGTTVAYFSSVAQLAISATQPRHDSMDAGPNASYFDSVVFLSFFLLCGRFLEAYSKAKTGDAVGLLGKLKPTEAILVRPRRAGQVDAHDDIPSEQSNRVPVDLLEIGDVVRVVHGGSPPSDGIIVDGSTRLDEASLTGESRLVEKSIGDEVYSGTVNQGDAISIHISSTSGTSMLDQIVKVVREGQTRRAPIERVADVITGIFVPIVVLLAVSTWVIWLSLGLSGTLPDDYRSNAVGGWPLWSLQFAIAVFVVACPCGIGLAAPTALFVGGGAAARHGILVKGGGEAFQEASNLDCIVFDKTGTLTQGGEPEITDHRIIIEDSRDDILGMAKTLEQSSSHPVAKAIVSLCEAQSIAGLEAGRIEEVPGKGIKGTFTSKDDQKQPTLAILGNEALLSDHSVDLSPEVSRELDRWKSQGKSVALLATSTVSNQFTLAAIFASSDPLRPNAAAIVRSIARKDIRVYLLSGDNPTTTHAIAQQVGIPPSNVIAGVLPHEKASHILRLQKTLAPTGRRPRAVVAMIGDGINDAPALAAADVSIAISSGSDIAIASSSFILLSSDLSSLLTLIELSRKVFRRVKFNFCWALVYNMLAVPLAAGVLYPIKTSSGSRVRLDPVWASLAMALSSLSVVGSSLLLRSRLPGVGFRATKALEQGKD